MSANPPAEARELERLLFWQGQRLRSLDFRAQLETDAQRRWWHNRALHRTSGVAYGFEAELEATHVVLRPGLAYDWFGRELVSTRHNRITVPQEEGEFALLACYQDGRDYPRKAAKGAQRLPTDRSSFGGEPSFVWKAAASIQPRDGVLLGKLDAGRTRFNPERLPARALARPRIATGSTSPGATFWTLWTVSIDKIHVPLGLQAAIDTSAAGFTQTPHYFTWLEPHGLMPGHEEYVMTLRFGHIASATRDGFTFRMLTFAEGLRHVSAEKALDILLPRYASTIFWLGIEPDTRPGPDRDQRKGQM